MNIPQLKPITTEQEFALRKAVVDNLQSSKELIVELIIDYTKKIGQTRVQIEENPFLELNYLASAEKIKELADVVEKDFLISMLIMRMHQYFMFFNAIKEKNAH